jgi:hypothetical protein
MKTIFEGFLILISIIMILICKFVFLVGCVAVMCNPIGWIFIGVAVVVFLIVVAFLCEGDSD